MKTSLQSNQRQVTVLDRGFSLLALAGKTCTCPECQASRVTNLTLTEMKARLKNYSVATADNRFEANVEFFDENGLSGGNFEMDIPFTTPIQSDGVMIATILSDILTEAASRSYSGFTVGDITWLIPGLSAARSVNNTPGRSLVTGTGATGFQVSALKDAFITYSPKIVTTATIAGGQDGYTVLEICSTNSSTAGDWKEIGRVENGQALSLALTLQSVQPVGAPLCGFLPAGWYAKIRTVNVTGTPTFTYVSGQEALI